MKKSQPANPKDRIGITKPPVSTVSQLVSAEVGVAILEGSCKYGRHNTRTIPVLVSVYYDATRRHMDRWWEGEDIDPDSGLHHVTKAIASLTVLRDAMIFNSTIDDRPPAAPAGFFKDLEEKTKAVLARFPNPVPPFTEKGRKEK